MQGFKVAVTYCSPMEPAGVLEKYVLADEGIEELVGLVAGELERAGHEVLPFEVGRERILTKLAELKLTPVDIVFNVCEGAAGEFYLEARIAKIYEMLRLPYTGSGARTLRLAQDKARSKQIFIQGGVPTPKYTVFDGTQFEWRGELCFPVITKPLREDASTGITRDSVVSDVTTLKERVETLLLTYGQPVMVEEYIDGRELNVSVVGNDSAEVLPISEIDFSRLPEDVPNICSFEAKWVEDSVEFMGTVPVCPAPLSGEIEEHVRQTAMKAYRLMSCRDYARVDIRLSKENVPYVLEVNPNPDISPDAGFIRSAKAHGWSYGDVMNNIVSLAAERSGLMKHENETSSEER